MTRDMPRATGQVPKSRLDSGSAMYDDTAVGWPRTNDSTIYTNLPVLHTESNSGWHRHADTGGVRSFRLLKKCIYIAKTTKQLLSRRYVLA